MPYLTKKQKKQLTELNSSNTRFKGESKNFLATLFIRGPFLFTLFFFFSFSCFLRVFVWPLIFIYKFFPFFNNILWVGSIWWGYLTLMSHISLDLVKKETSIYISSKQKYRLCIISPQLPPLDLHFLPLNLQYRFQIFKPNGEFWINA